MNQQCGTCKHFRRSASICAWKTGKYDWVPYWVKEQLEVRVVDADDGEDCDTWESQP